MSEEWPQEVQDELEGSGMLGEIGGLKRAERLLMEEAKDAFGRGRDEIAKTIRRLAEGIRKEHVELRRRYDTKFHPEFLEKRR